MVLQYDSSVPIDKNKSIEKWQMNEESYVISSGVSHKIIIVFLCVEPVSSQDKIRGIEIIVPLWIVWR